MKFFSVLTLTTAVTAFIPKRMTKIAGVEVIDTQIVRDAQALIKVHSYVSSRQLPIQP